jgi:para-aminobenzoate synthetase/4-amino-4-deoxychorismate lyase
MKKIKQKNVMIVDLIRNDLGKICKINSISVPKLFHIEEYETLYQMTSEIRGKLKTKDFYKIFKALFPSGSVTGAPKIKAMELIKKFENTERKIYTGAIGFITPNKNAVFNIPIRTIVLKNNEGEIGIGSGIVYDSKAKSEYREYLGKAKFLLKTKKHFALIETMRIIKNKGYFLLLQHLSRLLNSCNFFKINCDINKIKNRLLKIKFDNDYKIRLLVFPDGKFKIEKNIYKENKSNLIDFSNFKTSSKNIFLYHKTTNREIYNKEYKNALKNGLFDVIFINEKDEITEGCISNIFIKVNGVFYTPPVKCGLLPGIYRNYLLNKDNKKYREKILFKKDILNADEIYLCNSVFFLKKVFYKGV